MTLRCAIGSSTSSRLTLSTRKSKCKSWFKTTWDVWLRRRAPQLSCTRRPTVRWIKVRIVTAWKWKDLGRSASYSILNETRRLSRQLVHRHRLECVLQFLPIARWHSKLNSRSNLRWMRRSWMVTHYRKHSPSGPSASLTGWVRSARVSQGLSSLDLPSSSNEFREGEKENERSRTLSISS